MLKEKALSNDGTITRATKTFAKISHSGPKTSALKRPSASEVQATKRIKSSYQQVVQMLNIAQNHSSLTLSPIIDLNLKSQLRGERQRLT
jgi:hypothetical protein